MPRTYIHQGKHHLLISNSRKTTYQYPRRIQSLGACQFDGALILGFFYQVKQLPVPPLGTSWAGVRGRSVIGLTAVPKVGLLPALPCPVHLSSPGRGCCCCCFLLSPCLPNDRQLYPLPPSLLYQSTMAFPITQPENLIVPLLA